ncbi:MAG TPA: GNAT family N-acetyltransferase [Egibacteraceae bacterium]|nr:GNAT family N-acetyltransferase [Egibacteraceae bacterium]
MPGTAERRERFVAAAGFRMRHHQGVLEGLDYPTPPLADGVVELRPWTNADVGCIEAASSDPRIPAGTTVPADYTDERGLEFIERQRARRDSGEGLSLAIANAATGEALGLVVLLHREDRSVVGLGYWVVPRARSKGFASRAVSLISPWALSQPGVREVEAIVEPANQPSLRLLRRAAF